MDRYVCVKKCWISSIATAYEVGDTYHGAEEHLPHDKKGKLLHFVLFTKDAPKEPTQEEKDEVIVRLKKKGFKGKISKKWPLERLNRIEINLDEEAEKRRKEGELSERRKGIVKGREKPDEEAESPKKEEGESSVDLLRKELDALEIPYDKRLGEGKLLALVEFAKEDQAEKEMMDGGE